MPLKVNRGSEIVSPNVDAVSHYCVAGPRPAIFSRPDEKYGSSNGTAISPYKYTHVVPFGFSVSDVQM
jgi:hypothetical protein